LALTDNPFLDLPLAQLQTLQAAAIQAITDIFNAGQSNSFPGRSFTAANMAEIRKIAADLRVAINYQSGNVKQIAQAVIQTQYQYAPPFDLQNIPGY
jgi:hypothetical protein